MNNRAERNIVAVLGVGDIVSVASSASFTTATTRGYDIIDAAGLPYLPAVGNHDYDTYAFTRTTSIYDSFFGPLRFEKKLWYLGGYPYYSSANMAIAFDVSSHRYLVIGLEIFPRAEAVSWAQSIIDENADREVIIVTHAYLTKQGTRYRDGDKYGPLELGLSQDNSGERLWENFIKTNPRIFLVIGGHDICSPTNAHLISTGISGNTVSQIFTNYQCLSREGYVLLLNFKEDSGTIEATPFSTRLNAADPAVPPYILPYIPALPGIPEAGIETVTPTDSTIRATINDNGAETAVTVEYGLTLDYGSTQAAGTISPGSGNTQISTNLTGLVPGSTYHARVVARNIAGTSYSADLAFTVPYPQTIVSSINRKTPVVELTSSATVTWAVDFSDTVTGLRPDNFTVSGLPGAEITSVTGGGTAWIVTATTGTGAGYLSLTLSNSVGLVDSYGQGVTGLPQSGEIFNVDQISPVVSAGGNKRASTMVTQVGSATDTLPMSYAWGAVSGPGNISFGSPADLATTIAADTLGWYVISFTATDAAGNSSTATMTLNWVDPYAVPPVMEGTTPFDRLQDAVKNTATSSTILALAMEFTEHLVVDRDVSIVLEGGYYGTYEHNPGWTTVHGSLTIQSGSVSVNRLLFLP